MSFESILDGLFQRKVPKAPSLDQVNIPTSANTAISETPRQIDTTLKPVEKTAEDSRITPEPEEGKPTFGAT